jgi:hypothetical protein
LLDDDQEMTFGGLPMLGVAVAVRLAGRLELADDAIDELDPGGLGPDLHCWCPAPLLAKILPQQLET